MKEGNSGRRAVSCTIVVGGVLITAAAVALYTPWLGTFDLREVTVSGNRRVSAAAIVRAAGVVRGRPLMRIALAEVSVRVVALPWIKKATIRRDFPHGLRIRVLERRPVAWIRTAEGGACLTVGEGGVIVTEGCSENGGSLEVIGGSVSAAAPGGRFLDERVVALVERVANDAALSTMNIQRIDVSDPTSITLDAESGLRVLLGEIDAHARRVDALVALSRRIDPDDYRRIDLRLEGEATLVNW